MTLSMKEQKILYAYGCPSHHNTVTRLKWLTAVSYTHLDMGFAVVAKFSVNAGEGEYVTEYRGYKGSDWADSEISLDWEDLVAELAALCDPCLLYTSDVYKRQALSGRSI